MRAALILCVLLLAGCKEPRSFDEQYAETQRKLEAKASGIDRELDAAASDAALVEAIATPSSAPSR